MRTPRPTYRIVTVQVMLCVALGTVLLRVGLLTINEHEKWRAEAEGQRALAKGLPPERGEIFFRDRFGQLTPAAINKELWQVWARTRDVVDRDTVALRLAPLLLVSPDTLRAKLSDRDDAYEVLHSGVEPEVRARIEALALAGIYFSRKVVRAYPAAADAAAVTGFYGFREGNPAGQYGLEEFYEEELKGEEGEVSGERDTLGRIIFAALTHFTSPRDGKDLVLTIDPNIQSFVAGTLTRAVERWQAAAGGAIVLEPKTGKIRALVNTPSYDPNAYAQVKEPALFMNALVQQRFEPGSVFKPFTMAGGLEKRVVRPETTYEDPGEVTFGGYSVRNFDGRSHGVETMTEVLEKSLNTGAIFVQQRLGKEEFLETVKAFGFGERTEVDLAGEVGNDFAHLETFSDLQFATASFGQGIAVTPIALVRAMAAVANGGLLVKPHLVEKRLIGAAEILTEPAALGRAVSEETAKTLTRMLVSVVDHGPGYRLRARIPGYQLAGKTGTAQIPDPAGGYSSDVIHSFVGFGPASDPKFLVFLKMDRPQGERFAANTLTTTFREIAKFLIEYYEIPPDRPGELGNEGVPK